MDRKIFAGCLTGLFLATEAVIYVLFMYIDVFGGSQELSTGAKFIGILICAAVALVGAFTVRTREAVLIAAALFFTAVADSCLLSDENVLPYSFGVVCFCFTQLLYMGLIARIAQREDRSNLKYYLPRAAMAVAIVLLTLFLPESIVGDDRFLIAVTAFYGTCFVINIVSAVAATLKKRKNSNIRPVLFATGLIVFALCDLNVLLYNLPDYIDITSKALLFLLKFAGDFMWMFYLPAQVMIVKSVRLNLSDNKGRLG